eukprot:530368-Pleurochrysis_carterae.AAC.1
MALLVVAVGSLRRYVGPGTLQMVMVLVMVVEGSGTNGFGRAGGGGLWRSGRAGGRGGRMDEGLECGERQEQSGERMETNEETLGRGFGGRARRRKVADVKGEWWGMGADGGDEPRQKEIVSQFASGSARSAAEREQRPIRAESGQLIVACVCRRCHVSVVGWYVSLCVWIHRRTAFRLCRCVIRLSGTSLGHRGWVSRTLLCMSVRVVLLCRQDALARSEQSEATAKQLQAEKEQAVRGDSWRRWERLAVVWKGGGEGRGWAWAGERMRDGIAAAGAAVASVVVAAAAAAPPPWVKGGE